MLLLNLVTFSKWRHCSYFAIALPLPISKYYFSDRLAKTVTFDIKEDKKKKCESRRGSFDGIPEIPHDNGTGGLGTSWKKIAINAAPKLR